MKDKESSFEIKWSLTELENIVFEFINSPLELPKGFQQPIPGCETDVTRADLFSIKSDRDAVLTLPQIVRELIIHDRGNSLFLSSSFGNLPSPVGESNTIKRIF